MSHMTQPTASCCVRESSLNCDIRSDAVVFVVIITNVCIVSFIYCKTTITADAVCSYD